MNLDEAQIADLELKARALVERSINSYYDAFREAPSPKVVLALIEEIRALRKWKDEAAQHLEGTWPTA